MIKKLQGVPRECNFCRLFLYFVNVEGCYCVDLENAPQLPILDLCQEAQILLSRFKASLKAGITRGGLSFFLFFLFHYYDKSASQHWSGPERSWVLNHCWRVESYSFCDDKDSLQCSYFFLLPHCSSVDFQFAIAVPAWLCFKQGLCSGF